MKAFINKLYIFFIIFYILISFRCVTANAQNGSINYEIFSVDNLLVEKIPAQEIIFREENAWKDFWSEYGQDSSPSIDFNNNIIIAIFEGPKPNPGYGIEVSRVIEKDSFIQVDLIEYVENPDIMYAAVIVYPHQIIKLKRINREIRFYRMREVHKNSEIVE